MKKKRKKFKIMEFQKINIASGLVSFGNTSARMKDSSFVYPKILECLIELSEISDKWGFIEQVQFSKILTKNNIFEIKEDNIVGSDKDARVKTSFLSEFGFTNKDRIVNKNGFNLIESKIETNYNNELSISNESYVYLKQFLKYQSDNFEVLPFLSLIYACIEFENNLPIDFYKYLWITSHSKNELCI